MNDNKTGEHGMVDINPEDVRFMPSLGAELIKVANLTDSESYRDKCVLSLYEESWENSRNELERAVYGANSSIPEGEKEFFNALQLMKWRAAHIHNDVAISELTDLFGMSEKTATLLAECGITDPALLRPNSSEIDDIISKTRVVVLKITRNAVLGVADHEQIWAEVLTGVTQMAGGWGPPWQGNYP